MTDTPPAGSAPATPPAPAAGPPTAPTQRIGPPAPPASPVPAKPAGRRGGLAALAVAAVALLLALISTSIAVYAVTQASQARQRADDAIAAAQGRPAGNTGGQSATQPPRSPAGDPGGAQPSVQPSLSEVQILDPKAEYQVKYTGEILNPTATSDSYAYVDVDLPRIQHETGGADFYLRREYSGAKVPYFAFQNDVQAAPAPSNEATAADCRDALRTSLLNEETTVPAQIGARLCIATSAEDAREQGIPVRLVLIVVTALDGGKVTVKMTAWQLV